MAYPTINGPYGLKPVNLIGGQFYGGGTRQLPIQYGYATTIGYGDLVKLVHGLVNRAAISTDGTGTEIIGVFLGCSYTSPTTKNKIFSQYWPASTLAGDALAVIADDPDIIYKVAVCSATTVIGSTSKAQVGKNMSLIDNAPSAVTGDSAIAGLAVVTGADGLVTAACPLRIINVVQDTAIVNSVPYTSTSTVTITVPALTMALIAGSSVATVAANGQLMETGAFTIADYAIGATAVVLNVDPGATLLPNSAGTLVITQYPEALVKINFGCHRYNVALAIA